MPSLWKNHLKINHPRMNPETNSKEYHLSDRGPIESISGLTLQFTIKVSNIDFYITECKDKYISEISLLSAPRYPATAAPRLWQTTRSLSTLYEYAIPLRRGIAYWQSSDSQQIRCQAHLRDEVQKRGPTRLPDLSYLSKYDYLRIAAIPGSSLPSRYSSIAPPPVDT